MRNTYGFQFKFPHTHCVSTSIRFEINQTENPINLRPQSNLNSSQVLCGPPNVPKFPLNHFATIKRIMVYYLYVQTVRHFVPHQKIFEILQRFETSTTSCDNDVSSVTSYWSLLLESRHNQFANVKFCRRILYACYSTRRILSWQQISA